MKINVDADGTIVQAPCKCLNRYLCVTAEKITWSAK